MTIGKSKTVALRKATAEIQRSTGYGGLEKVLATRQRSSTQAEGVSHLSRFKKIQNPAIRKMAELIIDDVDGGRLGAEIKRKIEDAASGADGGQAASKESFIDVFNSHFDMFLDSEGSVKGNAGQKVKTSHFAPSEVRTDLGSQSGGSTKATEATQATPDRAQPSLTVISANHFDFSPTTSHISEVEIFANAIPTHEFSRCVPFLDVKFQTGTPTKSEDGSPLSISLARMILGSEKVKEGSANNLLVDAGAESIPSNSPAGKATAGSSFGMELFTSPQTLTPLRGAQRITPVLDPFRPIMSIESVDISIVPAAGLIEKKTARMRIVLHDRSRLHEIAELVRPENYGTNEIMLEWGWSHPDNSGRNEYGRFLNAMRLREKFGVYNSTFQLDGQGQVNITLDLFAKGSFELFNTSIIDNPTLAKEGQKMQAISKEITKIVKSKLKSTKRESIKPVLALEAQVGSNSNILAAKLNEFLTKIKAKNNKLAKEEVAAVSEVRAQLIKLMATKDEFINQKTQILDSILKRLYEGTIDPFNTFLPTRPGQDPAQAEEDADQSSYVSIGKLFTQFIGRPLLSTNRYTEVQMIFYGFGSQAGRNGALGQYSIAEFLVNKDEFKQALDYLVGATRSSEIPIQSFIQFMVKNFIEYPQSPLDNIAGRGFIQRKITQRGGRAAVTAAPELRPNSKSGELTRSQKNKLNAHREFMKTFRTPKVNVKFEAVPRAPQEAGNNSAGDHSQNTILRVHVFDLQSGRHDPFTQIVGAGTTGLETVKGISTKLQEARKIRAEAKGKTDKNQSLTEMNRALHDLINQFAEDNPSFVRKLDGPEPVEWKIDIPFDELKRKLAQNYPTLVYGADGSVITSAQFGSIQDQGFKNLQLYRYGRDPSKSPSGVAENGLPVKIQPTNMSMTMLGCPFLKYAQHFFVDFGTGTSADDMYYAKSITHNIRPGSFTTSLQMSTRDADGKFESTLGLLNRATQFLDEANKGSSEQT